MRNASGNAAESGQAVGDLQLAADLYVALPDRAAAPARRNQSPAYLPKQHYRYRWLRLSRRGSRHAAVADGPAGFESLSDQKTEDRLKWENIFDRSSSEVAVFPVQKFFHRTGREHRAPIAIEDEDRIFEILQE